MDFFYKKTRLLLLFAIKREDRETEIALIYMDLYQTIRTQTHSCKNQFSMKNDALLLFCFGVSGPSKYGCLNLCIVQKVSSFQNGVNASTHEI